MQQPDSSPKQRNAFRTTLAIVGVSAAGVAALMLSPTSQADPPPPPAPPTTEAPPPPPNPLAPAPAGDPNAAQPDPNAPLPPPPQDPGRVNNAAGGFSFVVPSGWTNADATRLTYGQALLTRTVPQGQTPPSDTNILLGKLDLKLFAGAEPDNTKAAIRLASDMGEFFMPFPGTRINQETTPLNANGLPGAASYYEVKFTDTAKPNGQIWAAALGTTTPRQGNVPARNDRWFVVWLGSATNPVDKAAAKALAESIRPWTPPPPPEAPPADPNAPQPPPGSGPPPAGPGQPQVGVPVPVNPDNAPGMVPPST
jgi:hypothetical protein